MPNQQDFVLNLVAELDEGSVQSDAARMANTIARTIEQAFEGLGQKIAESIMKGAQGGVQSVSGLVDPSGRAISQPLTSSAMPTPSPQVGAPVAPPPPSGGPVGGFSGGYQNYPGYLDMHAQPSQVASMIRQQIQRDIMGGGGGGNGPMSFESDPSALKNDIAYQRARQIKAMRDAGMQVDLSDEEKNLFEGARTSGRESLAANRAQTGDLGKQIEGLNQSIVQLQREMNESNRLSEEERGAKGLREPEAIKSQQDAERARLERAKDELSKITQVSGAEASRIKDLGGVLDAGAGAGRGDFGRALGAFAPIAMAAAQMPSFMRAGQVAGAGIENLESRSLMGGDLERLMAVQNLGGMGRLRTSGTLEAAGMLGATALGAVGSFMSMPVTGAFGAAAGAGLGMSAIQQASTFDVQRRNAIESRIGTEMASNQELYDFSRSGREAFTRGVGTAQNLGDPRLATFLTGGIRSNEYDRMLERELNTQTVRQDFEEDATDELGRPITRRGSYSRGMNEAERSAQSIRMQELRSRSESARSFSIDGQSILGYGASQGLVQPGQVQSLLANYAQGVGGSFNMEDRARFQDPEQIRKVIQMQAGGLSNVTGLAGMMQAGQTFNTDSRGENLQTIQAMFENAVAGGVDKAKVGQALQTIAASNQFMGGAKMTGIESAQALNAAQIQFGRDGITGEEMDFTSRTLGNVQGATRSSGGLMGIAGMQTAGKFARRHKLGLGAEIGLQRGADPESIKALFKEQGRELSDEEAQKMAEEYRTDLFKSAGDIGKSAGFDSTLTALMIGDAAGAKTPGEAFQARDILKTAGSGAQVYGPNVPPGLITGQQIAAGQAQPGMAQAQALAQVDSEKISAGLVTLGGNIKEVNEAFSKLIDKARDVLDKYTAQESFSFGIGTPALQTTGSQTNRKGKAPGY